MATDVQLGTISTQIPARLDRLPWSRFHWRVVAGLGTVWILDGLEVTIVGSIAARLTEPGSGISMTASDIGLAAAIYVAGACLGALFFGQLTDRFGRKKLMMLTLALYIVATVATAFAFAPWYFFLCRFFTGAGIGGEYAAINSAIDELIPARNRGQVDITINGSYWVGSAAGGLLALLLLNESIFAANFGWRLSFGLGALLGLLILLVRRTVPESPRWLFIHGRESEAERIVGGIEQEVERETDEPLTEPGSSITVRQRRSIPFREIAKVAIEFYPKRAVLGFALFVGQAFLYNAVTFNLGTLLSSVFGVASAAVPYFILIFAAGNFLGPLLLGRLFDTVGRKPMISGTYLVSAVVAAVLAFLMRGGALNSWSFIAIVGLAFFFASAGASAAYLTVSEIFPMETRALAIAFFYAVGTATGGIAGPLLFGSFIGSGNTQIIAIGFLIGAVVMALGGFAEVFLGVRAEGVELENIAKPLTAAEAEHERAEGPVPAPAGQETGTPTRTLSAHEREAMRLRERAEEEQALAAEHRATALQLQANGTRADDRIHAEQVLAEVAELTADSMEQLASSEDEQAAAEHEPDGPEKQAAQERSLAARERAVSFDQQREAMTAQDEPSGHTHATLAEAALERSRAHDSLALAQHARAAIDGQTGSEAEIALAQAQVHEAWAQMHRTRAEQHTARAEGRDADAQALDRRADAEQNLARAAEAKLDALRHRASAAELMHAIGDLEQVQQSRQEAEARAARARERDERIRRRLEQRAARERHGLHRFRLGPSRAAFFSPGMLGTASRWAPTAEQDLDREIDTIARALAERGPMTRDELARVVGARHWGPGRFHAALHQALDEGLARRLRRGNYGPPDTTEAPEPVAEHKTPA